LLLASPLTLALTILYFATFTPTAEGAKTGIAGLTERILVTEVLAWFVALGWLANVNAPCGCTRRAVPAKGKPNSKPSASPPPN